MYILACILLNLLAVQSTRAEVSAKDYVYWTKADIAAWHQYFPSRLLRQEQLTIAKAIEAVATLQAEIKTSLNATVRYQKQELDTALFTLEGTSAHGCVVGISLFMDKAIDEAEETFQDCVADVIPSLQRVNTTWTRTSTAYNAMYQKALVGIDSCARTYPNRASRSRLRSCVQSWVNVYFTAANSTTAAMQPGRAMGQFAASVGGCGQAALAAVVARGRQFLAKLVQCAKLSEDVNAEMYEKELTSEFYKYVTSNDLSKQIASASLNNSQLVMKVEQQMIYYYDLQKRALEKYVLESRDQSFYYGQMVRYLGRYLDTVASTSLDNPGNTECISQANTALNNVFNTGAAKALQCDIKIVNSTKFLIGQVNEYFSRINDILPYTGNVALISCFNEGYIFAEQTISNCYSLALTGYKINITEFNNTIVDDVKVLQGYETSFFGDSSLPCGDSILSRAFLEADRALYDLQRCLYIGTGTKYAVTTVAPYAVNNTTLLI